MKDTNTAPADVDGMTDLPTGNEDFAELEWVDPIPGLELVGTLTRPMIITDAQNGGFRVAYEYQDDEGHSWGLSERADYKKAFRAMKLGARFSLTFTTKETLKDKATGKATGKTMWRVKLRAAPGVGPVVAAELRRLYTEKVASGDDLPF